MRNRWILILLCCALALAGASSISAQVEHHVCRLLKPDEVKALLEPGREAPGADMTAP
jgi:hypothetical protein